MSERTKKNIRLIYRTVLSVLLIVTGIFLMIACVNIYKIGDRPFTPENISREFAKIAALVFITLGAVIVGGILSLVIPENGIRLKAAMEKKTILARMKKKLDFDKVSEDTLKTIEWEGRVRLALRLGAIALIIAAAVPSLVYALNMNNFTEDYNSSVISAFIVIGASSVISFLTALLYTLLERKSIERECKCVKLAIATFGKKEEKSDKACTAASCGTVKYVRIIILAIALVFITVGIFNGGMADVLSKAINICTECIGLG